MLTKSDKKFILDTVSDAINGNNKFLIKEMTDLFTVTNERIDNLSERVDGANKKIDNVLGKLKDHDNTLNNHERRIEKIEESTPFTTNLR